MLNVRSEVIKGTGREALLEQASLYDEAQYMMEEVKALLSGDEAYALQKVVQ
jgi:ATP-dependent Lhr-like helicase